jgi:hypothetical protein
VVPTPPLDILCARLGEVCYEPDFLLHPGRVGLAGAQGLGRTLVDLVMGNDPGLGIVPFGLITDGPAGKICTVRGTQMPMGSMEEWLADFHAWLDRCPLAPGIRWERGFASVSESLYVGTGMPLAAYMVNKGIEVISGHSLGGPAATNIAAEAGTDALIIIESPNPGDAAFAAYVNSRVKAIRSYWNPRDRIGQVPYDFNLFAPLLVENFVPVAPKILLDPKAVTPPVADTLWENHNLTNCRRMMEALA